MTYTTTPADWSDLEPAVAAVETRATLLRDLTRAKTAFQLRAITTAMGIPTPASCGGSGRRLAGSVAPPLGEGRDA